MANEAEEGEQVCGLMQQDHQSKLKNKLGQRITTMQLLANHLVDANFAFLISSVEEEVSLQMLLLSSTSLNARRIFV